MGWNDTVVVMVVKMNDGVEVVVVTAVVMLFLIHPAWFMFASWCHQN